MIIYIPRLQTRCHDLGWRLPLCVLEARAHPQYAKSVIQDRRPIKVTNKLHINSMLLYMMQHGTKYFTYTSRIAPRNVQSV